MKTLELAGVTPGRRSCGHRFEPKDIPASKAGARTLPRTSPRDPGVPVDVAIPVVVRMATPEEIEALRPLVAVLLGGRS